MVEWAVVNSAAQGETCGKKKTLGRKNSRSRVRIQGGGGENM